MFLILVPGAIISYLSLRSIQEKADNQKVIYLGTVNLVRDKLESEIFQREANFRNSIIDSVASHHTQADLQKLLQSSDSLYPAFKQLLLIGNTGELMAGLLTLGVHRASNPGQKINPQLSRAISESEKSEFLDKDYSGAIDSYRKAFDDARSPGERAVLHARIGRNYYKLGQYENGIGAYEKILDLETGSCTIGQVPARVVALHQISEGYQALGAFEDRESTLLELCRQLLEHPWDLSGGEYLFYLRSTLAAISDPGPLDTLNILKKEIPGTMKQRAARIMEEAKFLQLMHGSILEQLSSDLQHPSSSEIMYSSFPSEPGPAIQLNFFLFPAAAESAHLKALAFQFDEENLLQEIFPKALSEVELGKDVTVGILNEKDSLLYIQNDFLPAGYLVTVNFTRFSDSWKVALFDTRGKSLEQLAGREKNFYLGLFIGILAVMLMGIVILARAVVHESEISRMKSEFVSNVTHELKTPLALIRMFGETLESGIVKEEGKRQEFYSIIHKESERLTHLINNVLDFSRIDAGNREYSFEKTDLVPIIRNSLEAYKFHIRDRGFIIENKLPEHAMPVSMDKDAISQAFLNLLSNAVKYSEDQKYIQVEIRREKQSVLISVTDHGIGIPKNEVKKIFDKFYRIPRSGAKQIRGSGLGLTLTRHIIEAHKGSIEVESEPGKGSRFTLRLPVQEN